MHSSEKINNRLYTSNKTKQKKMAKIETFFEVKRKGKKIIEESVQCVPNHWAMMRS